MSVKEEFLHHVWKFKKFDFLHATTEEGDRFQLVSSGQHNQDQSGPDFIDARLRIGDQLWAGNVEIHLKSSDWYAHRHELDRAYDNVILHVVWEHDVEVFRKSGTRIPTLVLEKWVSQGVISNYKKLLSHQEPRWINCAPDFHSFSDFEIQNWLERLYIERLEEKSALIQNLLGHTTQDWEATLFCLLAKNFGLNINGDSFLSMAISTPFKVVRKMQNLLQMEALFFGQAGMLNVKFDHPYLLKVKSEYDYLQHKFGLVNENGVPVTYFRLRPPNFPTIRLSQLAGLYTEYRNLFDVLIGENELEKIRKVLKVSTSNFWETHYTFQKESKKRVKRLSSGFIDLLIINTVIPLRFCYAKAEGRQDWQNIMELIRQIPVEKNSITSGFNRLRKGTAKDALDSQALIQLKKNYCDRNRCLQCSLGLKLLGKSPEQKDI